MKPTRWTHKPRVTYWGNGGYSVGRYGVGYTHPVTGSGWYMDWRNFLKRKVFRHAQD